MTYTSLSPVAPLATVAELKEARGAEKVSLAFPDLDATALDVRITSALKTASETAVGYISSRYRDHLAGLNAGTCPAPLKDAVLVTAWWILMRDGSHVVAEDDREDYRDAKAYLTDLSRGAASLVFQTVTAADVTDPAIRSAHITTAIHDFLS